jgi:hypothetical protein
MLQHRKGKLTITKSNLLRFSYSEVVSLPFESILIEISRCDADLSDSVVSFISSSIMKIMIVGVQDIIDIQYLNV